MVCRARGAVRSALVRPAVSTIFPVRLGWVHADSLGAMGLFPGSKKYFREHSGAFSPTLWGERKPDVIVTDMMLILYMFDAFCQYSQGRGARAPCTLRSLAGFLWDKIAHPDGCEALERWQTHVVTFDVGGRSPRAKEATQDLRRSRVGAAAELAPFAGDDPDAPLPSPFSAFLRTKGALNMVVEAVVPLLEREFFKCMRTNCSIVVQCASGPILLRRDGLRISREPLTHVSGVRPPRDGETARKRSGARGVGSDFFTTPRCRCRRLARAI